MDDLLARLQVAVGDTYGVERELGGGGMSRLFLAHERSLDRLVVLKVLPPDLADGVSAERFRREVQVIARLQHPHVVPVLGAANAHGLTWYVMPYVDGESLRARMEREGSLPISDATAIVAEAASALAYAHRQGIVHRDIKPENILLADGHAVVADFGIAHAANAAVQSTRLTATGVSLGTIGYMSPEQASGDPQVDGRSDVYSLAMVGYEALTGRLPFPGLTGAQLVAAQVRDTPPAPRTLRHAIPASVSDALMRALAKSPDERFQTAGEFRTALAPAGWTRSAMTRRAAVALGAAIVILAAVITRIRGRSEETPALDANAVAIAPFTVLTPELALWKEGLVDVLARALDGMGPMRTVAPTLSIKGWSGHADPRSADALAKRVGARLVLFGTLQPSGRDSARVLATLYDAATGKALGDIDRRDDVSRIDRLADTVTVHAVRLLSRARALPFTPRASLVGSKSLLAIKEFLQGEQLQRGALFDSAEVHYQRAIDLDSTFALAHWGLANSRSWRAGRFADAFAPFLTAGRLNRGLGPRDSLLVLMDSVRIAESITARGSGAPPVRQRSLELLRTLTTRYSDDAVAWYRLGEVRFHDAPNAGEMTLASLAEPFDRAIAADAGYTEAYIHAFQIAFGGGDTEKARRLLAAAAARAQDAHFVAGTKMLQWLLSPSGHTDNELKAFVDSTADASWYGTVNVLLGFRFQDSAATVARLLRLTAQSGRELAGMPPPQRTRSLAAAAFEHHGQLRNARAISAAPTVLSAVALARLGVVNADSVALALAALRADTSDGNRAALQLLPFWAWRRDTSSILAVRRRVSVPVAASANAREHRRGEYNAMLVDGFLSLARADSVEAIRQLAAMPHLSPDPLVGLWIWPASSVFSELGRHSDAMRMALLAYPSLIFGANTAEDAEHLLRTARIAERAGEPATAAAYYGRLLRSWAHADPEFADYVAEARAARQRLKR